jgi:hypothetical protein
MANIFRIENGKLFLTLVPEGDDTSWQAPNGETVDTVTGADYTADDGIDFSCQVTSGALNASANTTQQTTPATFCSPESTRTAVGVTSYALDITGLQDANSDPANSISRYLFEHDTLLAYFMIGFDGLNPPKAIGKVRLIAGAIGGDARVDLTFTLSLPVETKPDIMFGNATVSEIVTGGGSGGAATGATAGTPGTWTPGGATAPANAAGATSASITASPTTAWTTGQYVQGTTAGSSGEMHWTGTAWASGRAT